MWIREQNPTLSQFYYLGQGQLFNLIPMLLVCFVVFAILGWFLLSKTTFGFRVYAVGGGDKTARLSGINIFLTKILAFWLLGLLSCLAGIFGLPLFHDGHAGRTCACV